MKNTISQLKNNRKNQKQARWNRGLNQRAGGQSRKKKTVKQEKVKRLQKNEAVLRELQDNMKHNNICKIWIPEVEEEDQGRENLFKKVMMENFHNLMTEKVTQIQETQSPKQEEPKEAHCKTHHN